ncbi:ABC transporter permease subunit [Nonomuraea jabiensis]|uniref:ABC-type dipeptide/oligopeptide/nickel transport system permease subunit/ABC-type antimicrobial peptide transport system permease subunit n=1 Tax=Nonomuraea jabiensis TaxID=882448 RepID=A0A7W9FYC7_9ACTN|nr:ABC transporter permease subunit [Nonomuraea jabiensis]MBB5773813.1 ABC-type dipeptide/oligopeptide/nickel transport system permease subunit/ABC-type antimicrobial peptide transport system permease subunit [Nonomuraea jabiensis]
MTGSSTRADVPPTRTSTTRLRKLFSRSAVTRVRGVLLSRGGVLFSRSVALVAIVAVVGLLPWLSGRDAALSLLRARSAEQEPTPEALEAIRRELGLDGGPLPLLGQWLGGVLRGDFGRSWTDGSAVLPSVLSGLGVSLTLMAAALAVTLVLTCALCAPTLVRGARGTLRGGGTGAVAAVLGALPEFLIATLLLVTLSVWLGLLPPYGWQEPRHLVLPALALGIPAGGVLGRLVDDTLPAAFAEPWVGLWRSAGCGPGVIARAALRRALPALVPQLGLVAVGLAGGAVAVETVFAVPGIGRTALGAAEAQDLPLLQAAVLALVLLGVLAGILAGAARHWMLGPGLRDAALSLPAPVIGGGQGNGDQRGGDRQGGGGRVGGGRDGGGQGGAGQDDANQSDAGRGAGGWLWRLGGSRRVGPVAGVCGAVLAVAVAWGLLLDPLAVDVAARLAGPSREHPLGADALGRDVLARVGHGAAATLGVSALVCAGSYVIALAVGLLPGLASGAAEVANAVPPVIAGILVAAVLGPGTPGASVAVALVSWPALAAHAAALVSEVRAAAHLTAQRAIGSSPSWILTRHVLPAVAGPVARHAVLRLPGIALAMASLGFLGLGAQPPAPEWGLTLAESLPYVERAPWAALAPAGMLLLLAALAVALSTAGRRTGGAA